MSQTRRVGVVAFILLVALGGRGPVVFADDSTTVKLMVGRSAIVNTDWPIARISLTSADVADAMVTLPNQLLIQGKVPGTISMFVWDRAGAMRTYDVTVERDLSKLTQQIRDLFPGETIKVEGNGRTVVVAGIVATKYIADKAIEVAAGHVEKKEDVVSLLQVRDPGPPAQVLLRVRFAEVSRSALTELGASLFTGPNGYKDFIGRTTTQQFPAPTFDSENGVNKLVFSDFLNFFLFDTKNQLGGLIRALQTRGLFQSLAEPNLVAETGKDASFLAGGEFPIPVAQSGVAGLAITVVFKEFGIRLNFTPTVTGTDRVRLKVRPEVSTLDFTNAIVLEGFRIPALNTRRTETEVELQDGQTFAIAGLLNNTATQSLQKMPGIGDIPILGLLFRSKAAQKQQTELVVMITPQILTRNSVGVTSELPRLVEPYLTAPRRTFPSPPPPFMPPKPSASIEPTPSAAPTRSAAPTPAESAAVLSSRLPKSPTMISQAELAAATGSAPAPAAAPTPSPAAAPTPAPAAAPAPAPAPSEAAPTPAAAAPADAPPVPRTENPAPGKAAAGKSAEQERKALEKQMREMKELQEREAKQAEIDRRREQKEQKRQQELAREEAKRQQELAREQAKRDQQAAEKAAKESARQAEIDKKQAEIDKKHQKSIDEAAARLKAAEAAYQAERTRKNQS